jgi:hypothetical protein
MDHVIVMEDQNVVIMMNASLIVAQTVLAGEIVVAVLQRQLNQQYHIRQLHRPTASA